MKGCALLEQNHKPPVIVFLTDNYENADAALFAAREILFKPLITYRTDALIEAGYTDICVVDGTYSDRYCSFFKESLSNEETSLKQGKIPKISLGSDSGETSPLRQAAHFLKEHPHADVFVCWADFPVTPASTLADIASAVHANVASTEENLFYLSQEDFLPALDSDEMDLSTLESAFEGHQCACSPGTPAPTISLAHHFLRLQSFFRSRKNTLLLDDDVYLLSTEGVLIHPDASIGKGTIIYPGTIIKEGVTVGENCVLGPNTLIERCTIGNNTTLNETQLYDSTVGSSVKIGPYCHIRPNSVIGDGVQIGDFVEVKNSTVGEETHISHLTYIGDSDFGKRINVGCGVVVVNYDGQNKHRTTVGDGAFIGCNTNLVSPVHLGDGAYTAAGSTITEDIPENSLGIARARQENKIGWAKGKYKKA